jgi:chromosome segregation ATPase
MDAATRKAAVLAMDSADDTWTIEDPLLDAARKIDALRRHRDGLGTTVAAAEAGCAQALADRDRYLAEATTTIREQISELERTLQEEIGKVAREKAELEAGLRATREAAAREAARLDHELARLDEIPASFAAPPRRA